MKIIFFLLFFPILSSLRTYCVEKPDTLFMVTRIKSKADYYIIHAIRNDSLFKIISIKVSTVNPNLELIRRGSFYSFKFNYSNVNLADASPEPLSGVANPLEIHRTVLRDEIFGLKLTRRFHYRIYSAKNLIGLYYVPNSSSR
jgi:hypothetical protein